MVECNIIHSAHRVDVDKLFLLYLSRKLAGLLMAESALLTGILKLTNDPYVAAKIAGIKLGES